MFAIFSWIDWKTDAKFKASQLGDPNHALTLRQQHRSMDENIALL